MAKHFNSSQFRSKIRQLQNKQRQAINNYNRQVRQYNSAVQKAVSNYNAAVRQYNSTVRKNRQIIRSNISKLNSTRTRTTYAVSLTVMQRNYYEVNGVYSEDAYVTPQQNAILDLIEQEQANSIVTAQLIENPDQPVDNVEDVEIGNKLLNISEDLNNRWRGAIFSLSPQNPDAARHFCTSVREIFTELIELKAPDNEVFAYNPDCAKTERGNATRREKTKYMMRNLNMNKCAVNYAESDIANILELFHVLSDGTHGYTITAKLRTGLAMMKRFVSVIRRCPKRMTP